MRARHGQRKRLTSPAQFDAVFKRGARLSGKLFLVVYASNQKRHHRLGLAVGRRVGGAVARNRAKRLLRESFRRAGSASRGGYDLVVVARQDIVACRQAEVDRELRERLRRIDAAAGPDRPTAAARA